MLCRPMLQNIMWPIIGGKMSTVASKNLVLFPYEEKSTENRGRDEPTRRYVQLSKEETHQRQKFTNVG